GRECLQIVERTNPNLVLLDIAMPEMDGWEVAQQLRRRHGKRPAILILSANAIDPHHMLEAEVLQLGEIGHVPRILEGLGEIENGAPECREFIGRMRSIVNAFDFRRYVA